MGGLHLNVDIKKFILIYALSRLCILFIPASPPDIPYVSMDFESALFAGDLPYPPLFKIQLALFLLIFGPNLVGYRIGLMLYEIGCLVVLYKFIFQFQRNQYQKTEQAATSSALKALYIFAFFPCTIFIYSGSVEFIATFFMLLALYTYYKEKLVQSSFFFCLGFMMEIYPIFCVIPFVIRLLFRKEIKPLLKVAIVFMGTFILFNFPFYLLNPTGFIQSYGVQFSRVPRAESLWEIPYLLGMEWNLLSLFNLVSISPVGLAFFIWLVFYVFYSMWFYRKKQVVPIQEEFALVLLFLLFLPFVFLSLFPRYFFMAFPLICILFESRIQLQKLKMQVTGILYTLIPIAVITLIFWSELNFSTIHKEDFTLDNAILYGLLLQGMYIIISIFWIKTSRKSSLGTFLPNHPPIFRFFSLSIVAFFLQSLLVWFGDMGLLSMHADAGFSFLLTGLIKISIFLLGIMPIIYSIKGILKRQKFFDTKIKNSLQETAV